MNALMNMNQEQTMSSLDFRNIVNEARKSAGENPIRNDDFVKRIEDELEGELGRCETFAAYRTGTPMAGYYLTLDQCLLVGMRESKAVRRKVRDKIKALEAEKKQTAPTLPGTYIEALQALLESEKQKELAIATKAEIGSRREATAMNTASQATKKVSKLEKELDVSKQYCTVKRMSMLNHGQTYNWRKLKSAGQDLGIESIDVFDANYGTVKAYHADVWMEAYAIEIE